MGGASSKEVGPASVVFAKGDASDGKGDIYRHPVYKNEFRPNYFEGVLTLYDAFERNVKNNGSSRCWGYRPVVSQTEGKEGEVGPYQWITYKEAGAMRDQLGAGLLNMEAVPANEDGMRLVGVLSKNRYEWNMLEQACNAYNFTIVPLYDTLGADSIRYIITQAELTTILVAKADLRKITALKTKANDQVPCLKRIITMENVSEEEKKAAEEGGVQVLSLAEVMARGKANPAPHSPPKPDDVCTFCYTSGTTGDPKGAMLTHANIMAVSSAAFYQGVRLEADDVHISYLPAAHVFERLVATAVTMGGGAIGFFQGNVQKITEDLKALRPTIFPSVPRLFNKFYDKIMDGVAQTKGIKKTLFNKGYNSKVHHLKKNHLHHRFWDKLVFSKVRARLGLDRVKFIATGSAPIASHVMEFLRVVFGARVAEGYGQTECGGVCCLTDLADQASLGHVGGPLTCCEVRLVSVPEMGYNVSDTHHLRVVAADGTVTNPGVPCKGRGEVCVRGVNVFKGYFKNPEKTQEAIDSEGWLHTGDVGLWTPDGHLRIIDRAKNIFKLSQGEYVAAEKVENVFSRSQYVAQCFIYGDSLQSALVAIVVPEEEILVRWAKSHGKGDKSFRDLCNDPEVNAMILQDMREVGKAAKLHGFEFAKAVHLHPELFSVENDLLTPTFKLKRPQAKTYFKDVIDNLYSKIEDNIGGKSGLRQGE